MRFLIGCVAPNVVLIGASCWCWHCASLFPPRLPFVVNYLITTPTKIMSTVPTTTRKQFKKGGFIHAGRLMCWADTAHLYLIFIHLPQLMRRRCYKFC